jgi:hypothetical protein
MSLPLGQGGPIPGPASPEDPAVEGQRGWRKGADELEVLPLLQGNAHDSETVDASTDKVAQSLN